MKQFVMTPASMLIASMMILAGCGGTDPAVDVSSTTAVEPTTSATVEPTTSSSTSSTSTSTSSTTSTTSTTEAPRPTIVVTDAMREFPAYEGDDYTLFYAEDPDPGNLGCEGFPQTRLWIQREDGPAELVTELPEAGTIYPGPDGRILIVAGCEGFLGSMYHADVSADGRFSNIVETYLALEAAYGFDWVDRDTISLTAATYEGAWGGKEDETRPLTIDLEATEHVVITTRGEPPVVATVIECSFENGTLTVVAEDDLFGQVRIDGGTVSYLDRTVTASDTNGPDPDFPLWNMFGTTVTGEDVLTSVWGPNCF